MNTTGIKIALVAIGALLSCAPQQSPFHPDPMGAVLGRVLRGDGRPASLQLVSVPGTDHLAMTDTEGHFGLFRLTPGRYLLALPDTVIQASVIAGDTTKLGTIRLRSRPSAPRIVVDCRLIDEDSQTVLHGEGVALSRAHSVRIMFHAFEESTLIARICTIAVIHNGTTVWHGISDKRPITTGLFTISGRDTFDLRCGDVSLTRMIVLEPKRRADSFAPYIRITTGEALLSPSKWGLGYQGDRRLFSGLDTFWILHRTYEPCDWDIYLVNDVTGDTCFWKNPAPDWNGSGAGPRFSGDRCIAWSVLPVYGTQSCAQYSPDVIEYLYPDSGSYSIYIRFYDGLLDTAVPTLSLQLGLDSQGSTVFRYYERKPPHALHRGQLWYAGKIDIPNLSFDPRDEKILGNSIEHYRLSSESP